MPGAGAGAAAAAAAGAGGGPGGATRSASSSTGPNRALSQGYNGLGPFRNDSTRGRDRPFVHCYTQVVGSLGMLLHGKVHPLPSCVHRLLTYLSNLMSVEVFAPLLYHWLQQCRPRTAADGCILGTPSSTIWIPMGDADVLVAKSKDRWNALTAA
jgi:hypothetical protein